MDTKIELKVDADKLNAFIVLNDKDVSESEIKFVLDNGGIKFGIADAKIKEIVKNPILKEPLLVASGVPPVDGEDAKIEYKLEEGIQERRPLVLDDGTVDYKDVKVFKIVKAGDVLAIKTPPTKGRSGRDVFGNEILAKNGKDVRLIVGKNVSISEDGTKAIADKDGIPLIHDGILEVSQLLEIKGDVDYSTGNIDFPGDVEIRGGVSPTFYVKATGSIKIKGVIEAADVSAGGNIECLGVKGRGKGLITAKGNIKVKFLENAIVECDGDLYVDGSIVNSKVRSGRKVEVTGNVGQIVGSNVMAGLIVIAKEIGSEMAVTTRIEVGVNPKIKDRIKMLSSQIYVQKQNLEKLSNLIKLLEDTKKKNNGFLPADKAEKYDQAKSSRLEIYKSLSQMIAEVKALEENISTYANDSIIIAMSKIHSSTEIIIGGRRMIIDKEFGPSIVKISNDKIEIKPYIP